MNTRAVRIQSGCGLDQVRLQIGVTLSLASTSLCSEGAWSQRTTYIGANQAELEANHSPSWNVYESHFLIIHLNPRHV